MGQATITAERGEGLYEILIDRGLGRIAGQIEAISLRILELEVEVSDAQQALDDAQNSGERERLQIALDGAIEAYRIAVDQRCTQESYKIPDLSEFESAYDGIRAAEDAYFAQINLVGRLNQDLAQATNDAFKAEQAITFWTTRRDELQEGLDYFEDLYTQAFEAAVECATEGTNCEPNWLFSLQELLTWYGIAVMAYNQAVNEAQDYIDDAQDDLDDANSRTTELQAEIEAADEPLEDLKEAMDTARKEYQAVVTKLRPLTDICDPRQFSAEQQVVDEAVKALGEYDIEITRLKGVLAIAQAHLLSAQLQRDRLQAEVEQSIIIRDAWCIDLTEGADGSVGTAEVPGEPQNVLIVPGAAMPTEPDGFLLQRAAMTPAQSAFNVAVLPGWQKWKPMYRVGTLVDKDDDLNAGSVDLDEARSSATGIGTISPITGEDWDGPEGDPAGLQVNQDDLGWIEFDYMDCDSLAFEVGDRVVVKFLGQDWSNPMIIGFESHPQPCQNPLLPTEVWALVRQVAAPAIIIGDVSANLASFAADSSTGNQAYFYGFNYLINFSNIGFYDPDTLEWVECSPSINEHMIWQTETQVISQVPCQIFGFTLHEGTISGSGLRRETDGKWHKIDANYQLSYSIGGQPNPCVQITTGSDNDSVIAETGNVGALVDVFDIPDSITYGCPSRGGGRFVFDRVHQWRLGPGRYDTAVIYRRPGA